MVIIRCGT